MAASIASPPRPHPWIEALEGYAPGEQPSGGEFIKLNTNEFPHPAAPEVLAAIRAAASDAVRLYPSPRCAGLRRALADYHGVAQENLFVTNGSDEALRLLIQAYAGSGRTAAAADPSYSLYRTLVAQSGAAFELHGLEDLVRLPESAFESPWDLFLLCQPNPPLGTLHPQADIARLAERPGLLVLDEAYIDFSEDPGNAALAASSPNVAVTRTFSKSFGLAGLRAGYVVAHPDIIETLSKLGDSYNVNRITQAAAEAAISASAYYLGKCREMRAERERLAGELARRGFDVHPSEANFVFARHPDARRLYEGLRDRRIFVRHFAAPALAGGIRISVGTRAEMDSLLSGIDSLPAGA